MELIERRAERTAAPGTPFGAGDDGPDPRLAVAENFLRAADAAVTGALSTNSEAYLRDMRQEGGQ